MEWDAQTIASCVEIELAAEQQMQRAKRDGKNRVYPPKDDPPSGPPPGPSPPIAIVAEHAQPHRLPEMARGA
jgi:hypothetical protein